MDEEFNQIQNELTPIKNAIQKKNWDKAIELSKSALFNFEMDEDTNSMQIAGGYKNLALAMKNIEKEELETAQSKMKFSLKLFPGKGFELERFMIYHNLGLISLKQANEKDAVKYFIEALKESKLLKNSEIRLQFLNDAILALLKTDRYDTIIEFLLEKIQLIDPASDETEFVQLHLLLITLLIQTERLGAALKHFSKIKKFKYTPVESLKEEIEAKIDKQLKQFIKKKKYQAAINFIRTHELPADDYLLNFRPLYETFQKTPSLNLALLIMDLFKFQVSRPGIKATIKLWEHDIKPKIAKLLIEIPLKLVEDRKYSPLIEFNLSDEETAKKLVYNLSILTDYMLQDPSNKEIMSFFLYMNEFLSDYQFNSLAQLVHSWISTTLDLRKKTTGTSPATIDAASGRVTIKGLKLDAKFIYNVMRKTECTFAPLTLMKIYFEDQYKVNNNKASVALCNRLSEFIDEISLLTYKLPDSSLKTNLLEAINIYTDTLASGYEYLIWYRMKQQNVDYIVTSPNTTPRIIIDNLRSSISIQNPLPFSRCLENTMTRWRTFPTLEKTRYDYLGRRIVALKPIFWMIIYQFIYHSHFDTVYRRLPRNEQLHHRYLVELIRSNLNFFYYLQQCLRAEPGVPYNLRRNIKSDVIKFLKKMNDMVKFTDAELREIVNTSNWKRESTYILADVIEIKNYCFYCSYNMPPGSEKCPNCGRDAGEIPDETPSIDFNAMGSFFNNQ